MSLLRAGAAFGLALLVGSAHAQETPPALGDVPAGEGRIAGRVLHPAGAEHAAGVDVVLYAIAPDGRPGVRRSVADAQGAFRFEGVSSAPDVTYLVGARYREVPFVGGRVAFAPGEREREVDLEIAERTRDPESVAVDEATLRVEQAGTELLVAEVHRLRNAGDRVVYATPDERAAGVPPAFRARLPAGVLRFALPYAIEPEGVVRRGDEVLFFGPIYPGEQELAFSYTLPAPPGVLALRKAFPSGAGRLAVLYPAAGVLAVSAPALAAEADAELAGVAWRQLARGPLGPGEQVDLAIQVPAARRDPDALEVARARIMLELDDAALGVSETYVLRASGDLPLVAPDDRPLLRVALPAGARDLRFGSDDFPGGVAFEDGALAVRGPVPPGESQLDLRYRLPAGSGEQRFARSFEKRVATLSVYVADTGLELASQRLHRRRPVRTPDERIYLHFEAFRVEPGEIVDLRLQPLARRTPLPSAARVLFVGAAALAVTLFLAAPLRRTTGDAEPAARAPGPARRERDALYSAIRDLDHDFETGKLAEEDYQQMREEMRRRAVALLREERDEPAAPPPAGPPRCPACGTAPTPDARFCARCGARLPEPAAPESRA